MQDSIKLQEPFDYNTVIIYVLCIILRSNITFILQIVHSYLKQYQQHSLEDVNEDLIVLFYSISSLGSTAVGGLLGGIITKKLGGYESKKSTYIVIIPGISPFKVLTCTRLKRSNKRLYHRVETHYYNHCGCKNKE